MIEAIEETEEVVEESAESESGEVMQPQPEEESEALTEDYAASDADALAAEFAELEREAANITQKERYNELRALGLTPREAYLATSAPTERVNTLAHMTSGVPRMAKSPSGTLSRRELEEARELFSDLSDRQIENLYKKVTK